ncbi:MAG TPA: AAA family ATPase, partial [bacterium]|nr:AAA family ATPase [bacterium]
MPVKTAPAKKTDAIKSKKGIKLRKLHIENFKAFDKLDLEFPEPRMKDDPDIVVMGSENGLGKTTVMEACALLFLVAYYENYTHYDALDIRQLQDLPIDLRETFIRAGASEAIINGSFAFHNDSERWGVQLFQHGRIRPDDPGRILQHLRFGIPRSTGPSLSPSRFFASLSALTSEPLLLPPLLYFHSYRKIQEGNPQFGMMFNTADRHYQKSLDPNLSETPVSALKIQLLHSMMSRAGLFEDLDPK